MIGDTQPLGHKQTSTARPDHRGVGFLRPFPSLSAAEGVSIPEEALVKARGDSIS